MAWLRNIIDKQSKLLLKNRQLALLHVIVLAMLPYTAWMSVSVVALVTLRKGWRAGSGLLVPGLLGCCLLSFQWSALINALLVFMPCYLAACTLRGTNSWRAVAGMFFLQVMLVVWILQVFFPDIIMAQYLLIQAALKEIHPDGSLLIFLNEKGALSQYSLASYLLGIQAFGVVLSAALSLVFARSVQANLFNPGGFKQEALAFRDKKAGLVLLAGTLIAVSQHNGVAMGLLPMLLFYFVLIGLSLSFSLLNKLHPVVSFSLLMTPLVLLPFIMLPAYLLFGSLDSLFNLRCYLRSDAEKTI